MRAGLEGRLTVVSHIQDLRAIDIQLIEDVSSIASAALRQHGCRTLTPHGAKSTIRYCQGAEAV